MIAAAGSGVSLCIPTYAGARRLERLFASFGAAGASAIDDEVLVWDDGSPEAAAHAVRHVCEDRFVRLLGDGQNRGWVAAQRSLVALATKPIVLLLDDDVVLPKDFFATLRALFAALPRVGALSWRSCPVGDGAQTASHSTKPVPGYLQPATHLAGYCMAFRRAVYDEVGGLDTRFRWFGGDSDLSLRMVLAGYPSYRVWWPLVPHEGNVATEPSLKRQEAERVDGASWLEKWGASGEELEQVAFERLT